MSDKTKLQALYAAIPTFTCKPGCSDCCGPVPFAKAEWAAVKDKREPLGLHCPYSSPQGCEIYENRPYMCRLFGATTDPRMQCRHGCAPKQPLSAKQAGILTAKYMKLVDEATWARATAPVMATPLAPLLNPSK